MIQITFKAKHYYFIAFHLKNASIQQYYSLINRIKTALIGNTDLEADITVQTSIMEIINIYRVLTILPEGVANTFNSAMDDLLQTQIIAGVADEVANGNGPDADGNIPAGAVWHITAGALTGLKNENMAKRNAIVTEGKNLIDAL
jgi:hypothetical protein